MIDHAQRHWAIPRLCRRMLGAVLLSLWASSVPAQMPETAPTGGEEITVDAESITYDQRGDTVSASGAVVVRRGDTTLRADRVQLNRRTNEADASGAVTLTGPDAIIRAERMHLDLDEETGELENAEIQSERLGYSLWGERVEKGLGQRYRIVNGRFTTCRCAEGAPSWSVAGKMLDVALEGYAQLKDGMFKILDAPVLYVPRAGFPVHRERQSGLLFPRIGVSNRRGFQVLQPLYWAIDKSQDATVGFDVETAARLGLLGEYRYAHSRNFRGQINVSYFNEAIRGAATESETGRKPQPDVPEHRWGLQGTHGQAFGTAAAYADLQLVGDDLFFREINTFTIDHGEDVALRTLPFTASRVGVLQRWDRATLQGEAIYYQDLIQRDALALQRAPEVRFVGQKQLGFDLLGQVTANATNFQRADGIAGVRGDVRPAAQLRLPLGKSFFGDLRAAFRETAYQLTASRMTGGFRGDDPDAELIRLPGTQTREAPELGADLSTGLSRVFDFPYWGVVKLKHTVEPRVEYLYIPQNDQEDLPVFDGFDRINRRSLVTYGVVSRLLARAADGDGGRRGDVYELTRLSVAQSYDFQRTIPPVRGAGIEDHFSDVDLGLRVNPSRATSVRFRSTYDPADTKFSSATVGVRLRQPLQSAGEGIRPRLVTRGSFDIAYRFITDSVLQQIDSSMLLPLTERIGFLYATRYDIHSNRFLENHFGLRLLSACDCWAVDIGVSDKSNPNEVELRAQVTLIGLGAVGKGGHFSSNP